MTMLTYALLSDPAPLTASAAGQARSTGTVYLMVTNTGPTAAHWSRNEVALPVGDGADDLTPDPSKITATAAFHDLKSGAARKLKVQPPAATGPFVVTDPSGKKIAFAAGDHLVLKLEGVPVAAAAGLAVLRVKEIAARTANANPTTGVAVVPLVKTAANPASAPGDFRPDQAMVENGDAVVLRWDGPADWAYTIGLPDGTSVPVTIPGPLEWKPAPGTGPKRDSTYTLVATDPGTGRKHFLTTTVQVRTPTFENGVHALRVQGIGNTGALTFTSAGIDVFSNTGTRGVVQSFSVVAERVYADRVQGTATRAGWITFPEGGLQVCNGNFDVPRIGAVFAESGIYQRQFVPGEENRWISMSDGGEISLEQRHKDGSTSYASLRVSSLDTRASQW
ncbi:hypothetical protein [Actinomadura litoris]|uniref:hypothetical protein n=1 Tax=Actinomadura litoris TaxID=2678616 RepID=UPI001FA73E03|nr:hypothetical protein [Actinomadura litoris]